MNRKELKQRLAKQARESSDAAMLLDAVGMSVVVTQADGQLYHTKLAGLPHSLNSGQYVATVEGSRTPVECQRIKPLFAKSAKNSHRGKA